MDFSAAGSWIIIPIQIFFLDLLLGADNAVVIAMACRSLRPDDTRKAIFIGTGGAVLFRFVMTISAVWLLAAPFVKLGGALILVVIALNLIAQDQSGELDGLASAAPSSASARGGLWSAALLIVVVDATMSLDNVVALAAIARGNMWLLAAGVLFSIPVLMSGSLILANLLQRYPALVTVGCGVLGWVAGGMAVDDPAIAGWANINAPALIAMAPALGAAYVLVQARLMARGRPTSGKTAPVARTPLFAKNSPSPSAARALASTSSVDRLLKTAGRAETASREKRAAPHTSNGSSDRETSPEFASPRGVREDRLVMIGLILLAALAGGMIALVAYLDNLNMQ
jgi:YjbE family integral membrane protein